MDLTQLVSAPTVDAEAVARLLDGMTHPQRVDAVRALPRRLFRRLFDADVGRTPELWDFVTPGSTPLTPTRHVGTNDLAAFRAFEKPMYRDAQGRVFGRNDQRWSFVTGPGYFEAVEREGRVVLDYCSLPEAVPEGWPTPRDNAKGLSFFVFRDMVDEVRAVSRHVLVGHAIRSGKDLPNHFILVREV